MNLVGVNSEYAPLAGVLLYRPGPEIANHPDPSAIQQLQPIEFPAISREFTSLAAAFAGLGIAVRWIDPASLSDDRNYLYNMIYCRDLFFMTPAGAILASMANGTRAAEPLYAARALATCGIPLLHTVNGDGRFEGADALWVKPDHVLVGVGNRTNQQGYEQVAAVLAEQGIGCCAVPSLQTRTQHLLGTVQIVDRDLVLIRHEITAVAVIRFMEQQGFSVLPVPESAEVQLRQAMNIVTIAPRTILMTAECPATRFLYEQAGLTIAGELELTQLMRGAGGLACATGVLARSTIAQ